MQTKKPYFFFSNDSECTHLAQSFDWHNTPLGDPSTWSVSLKNTVSLLLSSKFPMFLWWGEELIQFYNDAYRPSLGINGKHPHAMGQNGRECWPEIWDFIGPLIEKVKTKGESVWYEDLLLPIYRNGRMEDVYWTFSYSPIYDDDGTIQGVHVVCVETTEKVVMLNEMLESKSELEFAIDAAELGTWDLNPVTGKFAANIRLKEWFGIGADEEILLETATNVIAEKDRAAVVNAIAKALEKGSDGKYEATYSILHPHTGAERIVIAKGRAWFGENGEPYRFNGTLEDVTAERLAERHAAEMRRLTDLAVKSVGLGMFTVDYTTGQIEYSPEFAAIMTGDPADHLTREAFIAHVHPDDQHLRQQAIRDGIESGEFHYNPRVIWKDGTIHRVSIMAARVMGSDGKPMAFSGTARDITSIEVQQRALEDAERRLDKERRDNEVLFRSIIEQSPIATCLFVGREMVITVANDIMLGYWGKDASVIGMPLINAVPELVGQPFLGLLEKVYETGESYTERAALAKLEVDGKISDFYFDYTYKPLRTAEGIIYGVMDMAVDVTQQVMTQRIIDEQQQKLLASFNDAPVGIAMVDREGLTFRMANTFYCELVGRKAEEILDLPLLDALPELEGQGFDDLLRNVLATGIAYHAVDVPVKLLRNNTMVTVYLDFTYQPKRNSADEVTSILVVAVDVTQKFLSRRKVEASQTALQNAIELAQLATWKLDINNNTFEYSPRFMDWLGFTEDTKDMDAAYNPLPDENRQQVADAIQAVIQPGSSGYYENEHPIINRVTGQTRIIHASAQVYFDESGNPQYLSGTAQDVTKERMLQRELEFKVEQRTAALRQANADLANANEALEANNQELQQFAYIASHDLQEPVRKISMFTGMLQNQLADILTSKSANYIEKIDLSAKRMSVLISDILAFSKLANLTEHFEPVDLNNTVAEILDEFELAIEQKSATVNVGILPVIEAIPLQMAQLFGNLLSNALKYARENVAPKITLVSSTVSYDEKLANGLEPSLEYCKIAFSDNGIGFGAEYAEKIFNIFHRLHGKDQYAGTGIGLALCRKIVNNHSGKLTAEGEVGKGATFSIVLPLRQNLSQ